jgi:hypothetical protein
MTSVAIGTIFFIWPGIYIEKAGQGQRSTLAGAGIKCHWLVACKEKTRYVVHEMEISKKPDIVSKWEKLADCSVVVPW